MVEMKWLPHELAPSWSMNGRLVPNRSVSRTCTSLYSGNRSPSLGLGPLTYAGGERFHTSGTGHGMLCHPTSSFLAIKQDMPARAADQSQAVLQQMQKQRRIPDMSVDL